MKHQQRSVAFGVSIGVGVGTYLVYRLYSEEGLSLQRMKPAGKRKAVKPRAEKFKATAPDQAWSMEFVADQFPCADHRGRLHSERQWRSKPARA